MATNILQILLATDLFRSLDVSTAIEVLQVTHERTYAAGSTICTKGDAGTCLHIIKSGTVSLERDGTTRELRFCDYFGEVPLLTDELHTGTATAATRVEMIEIEKRDMRYLMSRRPNLKERVMRRSKARRRPPARSPRTPHPSSPPTPRVTSLVHPPVRAAPLRGELEGDRRQHRVRDFQHVAGNTIAVGDEGGGGQAGADDLAAGRHCAGRDPGG
jgi:signal-transduction protein with cAMP-binding, CBS, and nucleotidyltransferase domain